MTTIIFSPQPSHVRPVALDKTTTVISDNFCSLGRVPPEILEPYFGLPLDPSSFLIIFSHIYVIRFSHV